MKQFLAGIIISSIVWGGLIFAEKEGMMHLFFEAETLTESKESAPDETKISATEIQETKKGKGRRGKGRRKSASGSPMPLNTYDMNEGISGDALDGPGGKELSMGAAGGEDQLSSQEIDQGIDRVFKGIERCLLSLPPDAPAAGKIVFGMNIASSGQVTKVNLKGPNVMISGETGACFRRTVQSIRFRSFDGPDMVAHYPVTFD